MINHFKFNDVLNNWKRNIHNIATPIILYGDNSNNLIKIIFNKIVMQYAQNT